MSRQKSAVLQFTTTNSNININATTLEPGVLILGYYCATTNPYSPLHYSVPSTGKSDIYSLHSPVFVSQIFFSGWRLNLVIIVVSYNSQKRTVNDVWLFCHEVVHCQNALSFFSGCLFFLVEINARSVSLTVFDLIVQFCFWCFFYTLCCALPPVCDFFYYLNNAEN